MYTVESFTFESALLAGNRPGDPTSRSVTVWRPEAAQGPLPVLWLFAGHAGGPWSYLDAGPWKESLQQRLDRLTLTGMRPVIVAMPDLWTRYGGSQGIDSAATGPYARVVWEEAAPELQKRYETGIFGAIGHSSGGYAALVHAMRQPLVRAAACHAGDMLFEYAYLPDFPKAAAAFRREGGVEKFVAAFEASPKKGDSKWYAGLNILAMAACYSPDAAAPLGIALPFDPDTCELRRDVWERWLAHDPIRLLDTAAHVEALKLQRILFLDAGTRDEFNLQWGARACARKLRAAGVVHVHEEFDDGHSGTSYRFDRSLQLLADALSK